MYEPCIRNIGFKVQSQVFIRTGCILFTIASDNVQLAQFHEINARKLIISLLQTELAW